MWNFFKKKKKIVKKDPKYKVNDYVQFVADSDFIYCGEIWKVETSEEEVWYHINYLEYKYINVGRNHLIPECNIIKKIH